MNSDRILDTLVPGDVTSLETPVHIDFAGQQWNVAAFIGTKERSVLILEQEDGVVDPSKVAQGLLAALAGFAAGIGVVDNPGVRNALHVLLEQEMDDASAAFRAAAAGRGKSS